MKNYLYFINPTHSIDVIQNVVKAEYYYGMKSPNQIWVFPSLVESKLEKLNLILLTEIESVIMLISTLHTNLSPFK